MDTPYNRKVLCPCPEQNHNSSFFQPLSQSLHTLCHPSFKNCTYKQKISLNVSTDRLGFAQSFSFILGDYLTVWCRHRQYIFTAVLINSSKKCKVVNYITAALPTVNPAHIHCIKTILTQKIAGNKLLLTAFLASLKNITEITKKKKKLHQEYQAHSTSNIMNSHQSVKHILMSFMLPEDGMDELQYIAEIKDYTIVYSVGSFTQLIKKKAD